MKGTARPTWSQGRQAWLSELKAQGGIRPRGTAQGIVANYCRKLGWTEARPPFGHVLTSTGLEVLAAWEGGARGTAEPPKPKDRANPFPKMSVAATVEVLLGIGAEHARAVRDALAQALEAVPPKPAGWKQPCPVKAEPAAPAREDGLMVKDCAGRLPAACQPLERSVVNFTPSLGTVTTPPGHSPCLACGGKGRVRHGFQCHACHGRGVIRRTVEP